MNKCPNCAGETIPGFSFNTWYCKDECDLEGTSAAAQKTQQAEYFVWVHQLAVGLINYTVWSPAWTSRKQALAERPDWAKKDTFVLAGLRGGERQEASTNSGRFTVRGKRLSTFALD